MSIMLTKGHREISHVTQTLCKQTVKLMHHSFELCLAPHCFDWSIVGGVTYCSMMPGNHVRHSIL